MNNRLEYEALRTLGCYSRLIETIKEINRVLERLGTVNTHTYVGFR